MSSKTELLALLEANFTNISRIGIVFASKLDNINMFLNNKPLFANSETVPYSENLQFIIDIIKKFQVKNIDYLACNTLKYQPWINYYDILFKETGAVVGASDDKTGNIKYGGDWVMENTKENIELIYFTRNIEYYTYLLDSHVEAGDEGGGGLENTEDGSILVNTGDGSGGGGGGADGVLDVTEPPCFKEDTKILTDKGYKLIQNLRKGDLVKTLKHNFKPIDIIGKSKLYHPMLQIRIKDQLYKYSHTEYPEVFEDLVITGGHSILVDSLDSEEIVKIRKFTEENLEIDSKYRLLACIDSRASVYEKQGQYMIYHIALENDDSYKCYGIYANGLLVESCSKHFLKEISNMILIE